jgi:outer membrane immunogenic protein
MFSIRTFGVTAGASLLALIVGTGVAAAADLSNYEPPPAAPAYTPVQAFSWSGPYVGVTGGYGWGSGPGHENGLLGGAYAGYNFQTSTNWVIGVEGDFTFTGKDGDDAGTTYKNPWNSTVRGRVGYAMDKYLFYGTGGVAFGKLESSGGTTASDTKTGWTAGLGMEVALTQNVTGRLEYRHTDLGDFPGTTTKFHSDDIMAGIGVKF